MNIKESISTKDTSKHAKTEDMISGGEYVEEVPVPSIEYTIEDNYTLCSDGGDDAEYDRAQKDNEDYINEVNYYEQPEESNENIFSNIVKEYSIEHAVASITKTDNICNLCGKHFKSTSLLKQHHKRHPKMRICSYCPYSSYYIHKVYDHINTAHEEHRRSYPCTLCPYHTYYSKELRKHMKQQHTRRTTHNCLQCTFTTNNRMSLRNHIKDEHTKVVIYQCVDCEFKAIKKNALNKHMKDKHTDVCPFCDFASTNKLLLGNHVNSFHANFFYFTCPHCNYKTYYKKSLQEHVGAEHKEVIS